MPEYFSHFGYARVQRSLQIQNIYIHTHKHFNKQALQSTQANPAIVLIVHCTLMFFLWAFSSWGRRRVTMEQVSFAFFVTYFTPGETGPGPFGVQMPRLSCVYFLDLLRPGAVQKGRLHCESPWHIKKLLRSISPQTVTWIKSPNLKPVVRLSAQKLYVMGYFNKISSPLLHLMQSARLYNKVMLNISYVLYS